MTAFNGQPTPTFGAQALQQAGISPEVAGAIYDLAGMAGAAGVFKAGAGALSGSASVSVGKAEFVGSNGVVGAKSADELIFGNNGRKLDFLFNKNIDQSNAYNAARAEGNASRIGIADTPANRNEVIELFNEAFNNPTSIVGPGKLPGSSVREFFLPGVTGTGSKIQFVEQNGKVITIMAK